MNNLNNPDDWNIRPEQQGDGNSSRWNYALLVPMVGLDGFRWIWSKESQKEIEQAKVMFDKNMKTIQKDLELKYRQALSENRRETAHLELDLEKERQRVHGYRQALASQSQHLKGERQSIRLERESLQHEKSRLLSGGPSGGLFHEALEKEKDQERSTSVALKKGWWRGRGLLAHLKMEDGLRDIFKNDRSCAEPLNTEECKNGSLMWLYLRYWQLQVTLQTHQGADAFVLGLQTRK
ncbi:coiled-coil domain-containing protein 127b [Paramisgurnus dabryanus]|uniref:coiled-coil domain-containing protein 127b n=1 Tax=Paramisgurnus dabryanus TaxID=90735 RepID=UPI0031F3DFAA